MGGISHLLPTSPPEPPANSQPSPTKAKRIEGNTRNERKDDLAVRVLMSGQARSLRQKMEVAADLRFSCAAVGSGVALSLCCRNRPCRTSGGCDSCSYR